MQRNYNKGKRHRDISPLLDPFDSLSLRLNHGTPISSSNTRRASSSSSSSSAAFSVSSARVTPSGSFVRKTPAEILAHIFSFLDPQGFAAANLVCREWHSVASDDYAWKAAFERFFGTHTVIPRLSTTWRGEYIHRSHLVRYIALF